MAHPSYLDLIRRLPLPSDVQTRAFAKYVAAAHSWYKHLPLYPPVPFCFYLDPNAGRATLISKTGEMRFEDIVDENTRFHYTWQLTQTYRENLGYWNYFAPRGTSFQIPRGRDVMDTRQSGQFAGGPAILEPEIGWIAVPDVLAQAGTAHVTALVHQHRDLACYWRMETLGNSGNRVRLIDSLERHGNDLPADAHAAFVKWLALRNSPDFQRLSYDEQEALVAREIFPPFDRERERQIAGIVAVMQRYLATL